MKHVRLSKKLSYNWGVLHYAWIPCSFQRLEFIAGIDQHHSPFVMSQLLLVEHPEVGVDTGVEKNSSVGS